MSSKIDYKEIIKLIDLLEKRNLSEFELEVEGFKVKISRNQPHVQAAAPEAQSAPPEKQRYSSMEKEDNLSVKDNLHYINSPMVGIFYRSPDPSSPHFAEPGDEIKKGQTLCIIEAMKLMNEIESDVEGILEEIFTQNGKPVEYGQRLFAIKPH